MNLKWLVVVMAVATSVVAVVPAEAAKRHPRYRYVNQYGEYRDLPGVRARLEVTRRSYLDAGTEVTPGTRKFTDYVFFPNDINYIDNNWASTPFWRYGRSPLPGTFFPWP